MSTPPEFTLPKRFIGPTDLGAKPCFLSSFFYQFYGDFRIAPALHEEIQNLAFLVDFKYRQNKTDQFLGAAPPP